MTLGGKWCCAALIVAGLFPGLSRADLFEEVMAVHHRAKTLLGPQRAPLAVYVGGPGNAWLLRYAEVQINDQPPVVYEYDGFQADAIQRGGLHRLLATDLPVGKHHIRARLVVRAPDASAATPRVQYDIDEPFNIGNAPLSLELLLPAAVGGRAIFGVQVQRGDGRSDILRQRVQRYADDAQLAWIAAAEAPGAMALPPPPSPSNTVGMFNAAIALINGGRDVQAVEMLTKIGQQPVKSPDEQLVRDLANLTLGYRMLRAGNGGAAAEALGRVRSEGLYANQALLGLGWASLLPTTSERSSARKLMQQYQEQGSPAAESASADSRRRDPLNRNWTAGMKVSPAQLQQALAAWRVLERRNSFDPVVQEGMMLVAYALQELGQIDQATRQYERVIVRLEAVQQRLTEVLPQVLDGRLLAVLDADVQSGWRRWLADLSADPTQGYIRMLTADQAFIDALEARQPLAFQRRVLVQDDRSLAPLEAANPVAANLRARIMPLILRANAELERSNLQVLSAAAPVMQSLRLTTDAYLVDARFALARIYDPPSK